MWRGEIVVVTEEIEKLLIESNVRIHIVQLSAKVYGFVYRSRMGFYHIFINELISNENKLKVLVHELIHIKRDLPEKPYLVGINMQYEEFEKDVDSIVYLLLLRMW